MAVHRSCTHKNRTPKTESVFSGSVFCSYATPFCKSSKFCFIRRAKTVPSLARSSTHRSSTEQELFSVGKKMYLPTINLFSFKVADMRELLPDRAKTRPRQAVRAATRHFASGDEQTDPALVAESSPTPTTLREAPRLHVSTGASLSHLHFGLASTPSQQKEERHSFSNG